MKIINNNSSSSGAEAQSFGSFAITLQDDESAVLSLPVRHGHVLISTSDVDTHGMVWVRHSSAVKYFGGAKLDVLVNTILSGTTGTDGKITISTNSGDFYIENRRGISVSLSLTFLGIAAVRM